MKYISLDLLQTELLPGPRMRVRQADARRGKENSRDGSTLVDFDEAIDCRICRPKFIPVSDSKVTILRVGFRISLKEDLYLRWARFRLFFSTEGVEVASLFPRCITQQQAFNGRIGLGDNDELSWTPAEEADETEFSAAVFTPRILGHLLDTTSVFWDFLPWNWREPHGTDILLIALRLKSQMNIHLTAHVLLNVVHPAYGESHLEMPAKTLEIEQLPRTEPS